MQVTRRAGSSAVLALLLAILLPVAAPIRAQEPADPRVARVAELGLTLTLPPLAGLAPAGTNRWRGTLGASRVEIALRTLASESYGLGEPEDVLDSGPSFWSDPSQARGDPAARRALAGPFGWAAYAAWERVELTSRDGATRLGVRFVLAGLLEKSGYWISLDASPPPSAAEEATLLEFLQHGIAYDGPVREHRWTGEEARARWQRDAPAALREDLEPPIRTAHYLVLTNSSGGKAFARKMEECHDAIRKTYPFDDVKERRLLPVFLFRTPDQYYDFYAQIAKLPTREQAERSKGHAWRDYYATWYEAPNDPVHVHEATHQIFAMRLGLGGGGSWLQEGVAEYMSSRPGDRSAAAGRVKRGQHVPLARFVTIESLLNSSAEDAPGGDQAGDHYAQAALLIEFLRESKSTKERFPAFLARAGRAQSGDVVAIEAAVDAVYGVDLAGLEERWVDYCKKR